MKKYLVMVVVGMMMVGGGGGGKLLRWGSAKFFSTLFFSHVGLRAKKRQQKTLFFLSSKFLRYYE